MGTKSVRQPVTVGSTACDLGTESIPEMLSSLLLPLPRSLTYIGSNTRALHSRLVRLFPAAHVNQFSQIDPESKEDVGTINASGVLLRRKPDMILIDNLTTGAPVTVVERLRWLRRRGARPSTVLVASLSFTGCSWTRTRLSLGAHTASPVWANDTAGPAAVIGASKLKWLEWFSDAGWMPILDPGNDCLWFTPATKDFRMVVGSVLQYSQMQPVRTHMLAQNAKHQIHRPFPQGVQISNAYAMQANGLEMTFIEIKSGSNERPWLIQIGETMSAMPHERPYIRNLFESVMRTVPYLGSYAGVEFCDTTAPVWARGTVSLRAEAARYSNVSDFCMYGG